MNVSRDLVHGHYNLQMSPKFIFTSMLQIAKWIVWPGRGWGSIGPRTVDGLLARRCSVICCCEGVRWAALPRAMHRHNHITHNFRSHLICHVNNDFTGVHRQV